MNGGGSIFPTPAATAYPGQDLAQVEPWTNRFWSPHDFTYVIFNSLNVQCQSYHYACQN
jgi:hypothetical protein